MANANAKAWDLSRRSRRRSGAVVVVAAMLLAVLSALAQECRGNDIGDAVPGGGGASCDVASNLQYLLPCMSEILEPPAMGNRRAAQRGSGGGGGGGSCCSSLKSFTAQDDLIDCLCERYDSAPDSCKEALHHLKC